MGSFCLYDPESYENSEHKATLLFYNNLKLETNVLSGRLISMQENIMEINRTTKQTHILFKLIMAAWTEC